ncbi:MAG: phenylalanyl-tRNA synthetase beta chain [Saprospiraceae bacterium]|jgi:phenylalanyl-tRNA synthetase beta chain
MKVSLNWLKDYLDIDINPDETSELLTAIGLEVEGMEEIESIKGGLRGLVIGYVKECGKHPGADKLSLTKVDVGAEENLQIVCGAPNVAAGQKVVVATIGTVLYDAEGRDFKIKKGKIRGEVSEGMICAEDELGLGNDHSGIIVLPEDAKVGLEASKYYKIENDVVYEIGLTPNRSDATSHLGVAKDLAAALKINHGHSGTVKAPDVSGFKTDSTDLTIEVVVENVDACPRYSGVAIKGITVKESPDWLKNRLTAIGLRPINNIVDATNFVLHELGQPLHAFDADQIKGAKVIIKTLDEGATFKTLDEVDRKLTGTDLMICDGESNGMCIAGVFGGISSGVTESTKNIFLESAHFNAKWIRRSSMGHNLRTDAAMCFEKGSDPNITRYALKRAALLFQELAGGEIASDIIDLYPNKIEKKQIEVRFAQINRLIGVEIPVEKVKEIFVALEMDIIKESVERLTINIPTNKADVIREVDVIEEVLRIYGFNKVPFTNQLKSTLVIGEKPDQHKLRNTISDFLSSAGFNEIMAVSLTESKYFREILPVPEEKLVFVNNTSNSHLDVMRPTMLFSGLEAILHNQNRQNADLKLFEYGKSYEKVGDEFKEHSHYSLFITGGKSDESWLSDDKAQVDYYTLKAYVQNVLARLGLGRYQQSAIKDDLFGFGLKYHQGPKELVSFGMVQKGVLRKMDIKKAVFYAEFQWDNIIQGLKKHKVEFKELTKYPSVRRDLALVIDNLVNFQDIADVAHKTGKNILKEVNLFDVYENKEQLGENKKSYAVSFVFEDSAKTLKDKEVEKIMNQLIQTYEGKLGAVIRR